MAIIDIGVVTGDVDISGSNVRIQSTLLFETINKGMSLVQISGAYRASNNATATGANFRSIALEAGVSGDFITSVRAGAMTFGAGLISSGELYGVGTGDGGFGNITGTGTDGFVVDDWVTIVGYGLNDDFIFINPLITNKQRQS